MHLNRLFSTLFLTLALFAVAGAQTIYTVGYIDKEARDIPGFLPYVVGLQDDDGEWTTYLVKDTPVMRDAMQNYKQWEKKRVLVKTTRMMVTEPEQGTSSQVVLTGMKLEPSGEAPSDPDYKAGQLVRNSNDPIYQVQLIGGESIVVNATERGQNRDGQVLRVDWGPNVPAAGSMMIVMGKWEGGKFVIDEDVRFPMGFERRSWFHRHIHRLD